MGIPVVLLEMAGYMLFDKVTDYVLNKMLEDTTIINVSLSDVVSQVDTIMNKFTSDDIFNIFRGTKMEKSTNLYKAVFNEFEKDYDSVFNEYLNQINLIQSDFESKKSTVDNFVDDVLEGANPLEYIVSLPAVHIMNRSNKKVLENDRKNADYQINLLTEQYLRAVESRKNTVQETGNFINGIGNYEEGRWSGTSQKVNTSSIEEIMEKLLYSLINAKTIK